MMSEAVLLFFSAWSSHVWRAAWQGGIREGDIILRIDRRPVAGIDAYRKTVGEIRRGNMVSVLLMREGSQMYVAFRAR